MLLYRLCMLDCVLALHGTVLVYDITQLLHWAPSRLQNASVLLLVLFSCMP